jgi:hypothetical protein
VIHVTNAFELRDALAAVQPGQIIDMADGLYDGKQVKDPSGKEPGYFWLKTSGTPAAPITLRGSRNAVLSGGSTGGGYALHLVGAHYIHLQGFTAGPGSKGIVLDNSSHVTLDGVRVTNIGQEGVHFRTFSSDNLIQNSEVDHTGVDSPNFGEGIYIGSANSNWGTYTDGGPDNSDRNWVVNNRVWATGAECVDIKEGSSGGMLRGNWFDGDSIEGKNSADSWIDVKGNGYVIDQNHGVHPDAGYSEGGVQAFLDGFEVHVALAGWGRDNVFSSNTLEVNAAGVGIWIQKEGVDAGNVVRCDNTVTGALGGNFGCINHDPTPPPFSCTP